MVHETQHDGRVRQRIRAAKNEVTIQNRESGWEVFVAAHKQTHAQEPVEHHEAVHFFFGKFGRVLQATQIPLEMGKKRCPQRPST